MFVNVTIYIFESYDKDGINSYEEISTYRTHSTSKKFGSFNS